MCVSMDDEGVILSSCYVVHDSGEDKDMASFCNIFSLKDCSGSLQHACVVCAELYLPTPTPHEQQCLPLTPWQQTLPFVQNQPCGFFPLSALIAVPEARAIIILESFPSFRSILQGLGGETHLFHGYSSACATICMPTFESQQPTYDTHQASVLLLECLWNAYGASWTFVWVIMKLTCELQSKLIYL